MEAAFAAVSKIIEVMKREYPDQVEDLCAMCFSGNQVLLEELESGNWQRVFARNENYVHADPFAVFVATALTLMPAENLDHMPQHADAAMKALDALGVAHLTNREEVVELLLLGDTVAMAGFQQRRNDFVDRVIAHGVLHI